MGLFQVYAGLRPIASPMFQGLGFPVRIPNLWGKVVSVEVEALRSPDFPIFGAQKQPSFDGHSWAISTLNLQAMSSLALLKSRKAP